MGQSENQSGCLKMMIQNRKGEENDLFQLFEGTVPGGFKKDFDESLFNSQTHRAIQSSNKWHSFHLLRRNNKKVLASIHFCLSGPIASSPQSAPFGSFELSDGVSTEQLFEFIQFVEVRLIDHGVKRIVIKCPPEQYDIRQNNILSVLLFNHQYRINNAELGACLAISKTPFQDGLNSWERRKLKQSLKANLSFKMIPIGQLSEIYNFILACRDERGQDLSMTYKELSTTVMKLMNHFILFGVYQKNELVAASIAIKVNKKVMYNFYSAHSKSFDSLSPVVFLSGKMYDWCSNRQIEILDLGTSASGGKPNFPLIDFKLRLGAQPTMKLTFEKTIR